ncbi:MAG TPA: radical SAM protein [Gemmatimonadaceae bacterium]|nr:radical SAM protein [Gemmatimonadaceae bacterium]
MSLPPGATASTRSDGVNFLWLELTNRCNLQCVHCYAESSPFSGENDRLEAADYMGALTSAAELGCKQVQFIGGEPTLNRSLPDFIAKARFLDYEFVEVFTNLTRVPQPLLECFVEHDVNVATSFYSDRPEVHDAITKKPGSHRQTVRGIDAVLAARLRLRAGIISMPENEDHIDDTIAFLTSRGVTDIGTDRVREFGRGTDETGDECMSNLCGNCSGSTLCVAPDGSVSPCIMSKPWSVGSLLESPLAEVVSSNKLRDVRRRIYDNTIAKREQDRMTPQAQCDPSCNPCFPACVPACNPSCGPSCVPYCSPSCVPSCGPSCNPSR